MDLQQLEYNADVRIKFAAVNQNGELLGDAYQEYIDLFSDFADGWEFTENPETIKTRTEWMRRCWVIRYDDKKTEIAAVEHETGVEILIQVVSGIALEATLTLAGWAWTKWKISRASALPVKIEPSLLIETVTERSASGDIRTISKVEVRGPLSGEDCQKYIREALAK